MEKYFNKFEKQTNDASILQIKELDGYIKEVNNDYDSVVKAIILDYNNGLAEGSVNKLKTIKRIMYGRNNFELLRSKIIQLENLKRINKI
ncbi:transposase [uncultured Clostridium sp.]|uniref:transposase n=1 Tax=uncultured Clostridium sp. TaxID=59620 RepID=UPI0034558AD0